MVKISVFQSVGIKQLLQTSSQKKFYPKSGRKLFIIML
jgi:hypothetical protein